jgi:hypothetical protein
MAKQINIKHWTNDDGDVCVSIEPYITHLDHTKKESAQWQLDSPNTKDFSIEFPNTSPFADDRKKFDQKESASTHVQKKDKSQHKYNIVVDGITIDPIIIVKP